MQVGQICELGSAFQSDQVHSSGATTGVIGIRWDAVEDFALSLELSNNNSSDDARNLVISLKGVL